MVTRALGHKAGQKKRSHALLAPCAMFDAQACNAASKICIGRSQFYWHQVICFFDCFVDRGKDGHVLFQATLKLVAATTSGTKTNGAWIAEDLAKTAAVRFGGLHVKVLEGGAVSQIQPCQMAKTVCLENRLWSLKTRRPI